MNKTRWLFLLLSFTLLLCGIPEKSFPAEKLKTGKTTTAATAAEARKQIFLIEIDAPITPVVAEYIVKSIDRAQAERAEAIIIQLNTPGGLVDSMQQIVMKMMAADVPTVVYVAPSGARAASAGVFITMAAHIAAMAPTTHMGAAHPVTMQGKMDKTMEAKVVNDLAAMARGIAEKRGKNAKWAEQAVRKSVSITETEALKDHVIDLVAPDVDSLVREMNGRTVDLVIGKKTLQTTGAEVKKVPMGFRYRLLEIISNPNIAYILMILGFYGLYFELSNPGAIFPGVAGAICLVLAFYALHTLPINYAGLILIIIGISLFIAEAFITSHGVLGVGGTIAMLLGSVMLIDSPSPVLQISWAVIIPAVGISALLFIITVTVAVRVYREKPTTGREGMVGMLAEAKTDIHADGQVFMRGEYWSAWSDEPITKGEKVTVIAIEGLKVKVKKTG
ncbi:MAG TPA: nodulation protein NfeD [Nitrospirota bacterium]|nr:nodulation protein NfeD [Nitrospirota bacterium]